MKRLASIIFLLILLLNLVGAYVYFGVRMVQIRKEMRAELRQKDEGELEKIVLTIKEYKEALIEEDEMELNDKMYDISRTKLQDDKIIVYCLHDENEDNLLVLLDSILNNSSKDKKPVPSSLLGFVNLISLPVQMDNSLIEISKEVHYTVYYFSKSSSPKLILAPPPKG
ncbi:MAG: hypothetical protein JNM78_15075 [Cyclobacteriaceae bacterium]|nr:hypothetical protein [Cyclobacteriaceae bacterium]